MSAARLLADLEGRGVRVSADGDRLRVNAAAGALTDDLKARISTQKAELLALLASRSRGPEGEYPASFAQRRLWFLDQLEPGSRAYNLGALCPLPGAIDPAALEAALNDVRRHQPALRTVFRDVDGEPVQVVQPFQPAPLACIDLTAFDPAHRDEECRRLTAEEAARPFDLARGPLFRTTLVRLGPEGSVLLFTLHHIIGDGWSLGIFVADLTAAYEARVAGRAPTFEPLAVHFGEHAARERAALSGAALDPLLEYWRSRLAGAAPVLELPTDRPRPRQRTAGGASIDFTLPAGLADALKGLARSERATPYMTLLAVFKALLFRYSHQADIVIGTPMANRNASNIEKVIGMFVGTLPIRSTLAPDLTARSLIAQIRENVLDAQAHSALPFERMVDALHPERSMAWSPIFQVVFALQNTPLASRFGVTTVASLYDLSLFMWDEPGGIRGTFEYNTDLFDAGTIRAMAEHFVTLAESIVGAPDQSVARLPLLTAAGRRQLLTDWNATSRPYPRDAGLHSLFDAAVRRQPDAVALESADPAHEPLPLGPLTYAELAGATDRLAARLRLGGVEPGATVGLYVERSVGAVVAILAIVKAGAAYVPIDPADPRGRVETILRDAGARTVVCLRSLADRLTTGGAEILILEDEWAAAGTAAPLPAPGSADALAYVMFTSGTTGIPKGVGVTHRNVARLVCNPDYVELGPAETVLQLAPLAFDASTFEIWGALLNGGRLVVYPGRVPAAGDLAQALRRHRISTLWLTAGLFHYMAEKETEALAGVGQVLAGGDVLSVSQMQRLLDAKRDGAVINGYGPTENTTFTCCHRMEPGVRLGHTVPIGRPIANTRVYILDPAGEPVPVGVAGELFAGGDGVARGYLGDASATALKFVPDPFAPAAGATMYRTGDMARWRADGTIEFLGRRDRQVKIRGFRIELEEIEDALQEDGATREAAVIARADASGAHTLVAYVVPRAGAALDTADLRQRLGQRLPDYMVPAHIVTLDALPLTPNGKLDRNALPEPAPLPQAATEPSTMLETQLHAIWERVLGRTGIGIHDSFFDIGGHSLLAIRLFAMIERVLGPRMPISVLFEAQTIAELAARMAQGGAGARWASLVAIQPEGSRPPLFLVPGLGGNVVCYGELTRQLGPGQPLYALQSRGLDGRETPFDRIEPMAAHYLDEVRRVQPRGPYRLGGTCFGGVVAYEMAQQLRAAGEDVELLFLIETWPPPRRRPIRDRVMLHSHHIRFLGSAIKRNLLALAKVPPRRLLAALRERAETVKQIAAQRDLYRGNAATMYADRVSVANYRAMLHYTPRPYPGRLLLAVASGREFTGPDRRHLWRKLAPAGYAELDTAATDSGVLLKAPHVETLATWMSAQLAPTNEAAPGTTAD